jgi:hypothetical protein
MKVLKGIVNGVGLAVGCVGGLVILPFFVLFLMLRAAVRGLYNMTHPDSQIPNPESFFKPKPRTTGEAAQED